MKKKKKSNRNKVDNEIQEQSIDHFDEDIPEEEFKLIIPDPKPRKRKRKKSVGPVRYHDMRLVWLFLLLAGAILLVRAVVCQHFNIPFLNIIDPNSPDGKEFIGHSGLSETYNQLEICLKLVEALVCVIACGLFVQGPKNKNSRNDGSEEDSLLIELWKFGIMFFPLIVVKYQSYWWLVYGVVMLSLAYIIGRYKGFPLPLFKDLGKNLWYGSKDVTTNSRYGSVFLPGHSVIWVSIIGMGIFIAMLIYSLREAW